MPVISSSLGIEKYVLKTMPSIQKDNEPLLNVCLYPILTVFKYSGVRVIASRILHEICLLIGALAIRRTNLTLIVRLGFKSDLLIEQYCY